MLAAWGAEPLKKKYQTPTALAAPPRRRRRRSGSTSRRRVGTDIRLLVSPVGLVCARWEIAVRM
jgi:hypothetical protein